MDLGGKVVSSLQVRERQHGQGEEGGAGPGRDGAEGLPEYAPFDRVLVEAAAVRPPRALTDQLAPDGRLVMPLGASDQSLAVFDGRDAEPEKLAPVRFKPLLVEGEQPGGIERNRTAREESERRARAAERRRGWEQDWIDWDAVGDL
jgi:protein-L-isoaspartate(D-aspartate) O-methyltransferase